MKTIAIVGVVIVALVLILNLTGGDESVNDNEPVVNETIETSTNEGVRAAEEGQTVKEVSEAGSAGLYTQYDSNLEQYEGKNIVLFFKADWCPSCRVLDADLRESLSDIPEDVVVLELNYDTETELKKKYGVTTQHTMVQVDTSGEMIKKWSGGNRLEDLLSQIN